MVRVKVKAFATVRSLIGSSLEMELQGNPTVYDLLNEIFRKCGEHVREMMINPQTGKLFEYFKILRNGRNIDFLQGLDTPLKNGDEIAIFPPVGGG